MQPDNDKELYERFGDFLQEHPGAEDQLRDYVDREEQQRQRELEVEKAYREYRHEQDRKIVMRTLERQRRGRTEMFIRQQKDENEH